MALYRGAYYPTDDLHMFTIRCRNTSDLKYHRQNMIAQKWDCGGIHRQHYRNWSHYGWWMFSAIKPKDKVNEEEMNDLILWDRLYAKESE